jgi:hypothetical protein
LRLKPLSDAFPPGPFDFLVECSAEPSVLAGIDYSPDYLIQSNLMGAYAGKAIEMLTSRPETQLEPVL